MTEEERADVRRRSDAIFRLVDIPRCAAEQYPRLVLGQNDVSVFARTLPWDHAAGTLFVNEAGGRCQRLDGSPYMVGDLRRGLLGASRSEERRVGKACGSTCRSGGTPDNLKTRNQDT